MSPGNKAQCVLTQEGSDNKNKPTASADKNPQRMKHKFNFLDTQGYIRICLCFTLEGAIAKPLVLSTGALCLLGWWWVCSKCWVQGGESVAFANTIEPVQKDRSSDGLDFHMLQAMALTRNALSAGVQGNEDKIVYLYSTLNGLQSSERLPNRYSGNCSSERQIMYPWRSLHCLMKPLPSPEAITMEFWELVTASRLTSHTLIRSR